MATILVTGASGVVGTALRPLLRHHRVRLTDLREPAEPVEPNETFSRADLDDVDQLSDLAAGSDLVVHLAGVIDSPPFPELVRSNIVGVFNALEAARRAGVTRLLNASTNHVVGYTAPADAATTTSLPVRPDSSYGASKAAGEAIASLFADDYGMTVVSARILSFLPQPTSIRTLGTWLSPADMARLVEAAAVLDRPGHHRLWGVSRNTRRWASLAEGEAIGYHPQDDAEQWAEEILAGADPDDPSLRAVGGRPAPREA